MIAICSRHDASQDRARATFRTPDYVTIGMDIHKPVAIRDGHHQPRRRHVAITSRACPAKSGHPCNDGRNLTRQVPLFNARTNEQAQQPRFPPSSVAPHQTPAVSDQLLHFLDSGLGVTVDRHISRKDQATTSI